MARAEDILRAWQIVLPAPSTLEELVVSVTAQVQDDVYTRIVAGLSPDLQQAIDTLLQVSPGERTSLLLQLKEYGAPGVITGKFTVSIVKTPVALLPI